MDMVTDNYKDLTNIARRLNDKYKCWTINSRKVRSNVKLALKYTGWDTDTHVSRNNIHFKNNNNECCAQWDGQVFLGSVEHKIQILTLTFELRNSIGLCFMHKTSKIIKPACSVLSNATMNTRKFTNIFYNCQHICCWPQLKTCLFVFILANFY